MNELVTREDFARMAMRLSHDGMTRREIAEHFGVAESTVRNWINDPDGSKLVARKRSYQGICEDCGGPTDGSNGRARAPKLCDPCTRAKKRAKCGTLSAYQRGCRCDDCRRVNREYARSLKTGEAPNHGTMSGYKNYACRCEPCRAAWREYERLIAYPLYKRPYIKRKRAERQAAA